MSQSDAVLLIRYSLSPCDEAGAVTAISAYGFVIVFVIVLFRVLAWCISAGLGCDSRSF